MNHIITIDGPSGTGKSTVARRVAQSLDFTFLDTGAIYRTAALHISNMGIDTSNGPACAEALKEAKIDLNNTQVSLNGEDVSLAIRENHISQLASIVAALPEVRAQLLRIQQQFPETHHTVAEGRDTGSVVFPMADIKLYLDASASERAKRRHLELTSLGAEIDFEKILADIEERDLRDKTRKTSPLVVPDDAFVLDTTHLTLDEVIESVLNYARERLAH